MWFRGDGSFVVYSSVRSMIETAAHGEQLGYVQKARKTPAFSFSAMVGHNPERLLSSVGRVKMDGPGALHDVARPGERGRVKAHKRTKVREEDVPRESVFLRRTANPRLSLSSRRGRPGGFFWGGRRDAASLPGHEIADEGVDRVEEVAVVGGVVVGAVGRPPARLRAAAVDAAQQARHVPGRRLGRRVVARVLLSAAVGVVVTPGAEQTRARANLHERARFGLCA
mmetsp:Transcript_15210/g.61151  ORF Transcript_15210/g.61151 Transcript_15210/m.61151 type:complete len:226 (+) Transcript_15210:64-741(+)